MANNDHVKKNTPAGVNRKIEQEMLQSIRYYSHNLQQIPERIKELEQEWDIERALEVNAALLALTGTVLGATVNKKWLILPAVVTAFLTQHAVQGWCPPMPLLRAMGFRTRQEIDREKYALKALAGDFKNTSRVEKIWEAVND